jgi:type I restriction enzyme S subunit
MSIPALRFKEFSSDWEEKTLGDIGENIIGLTYSPSNITDDKSYPIVLRSSNIKNDMLDLNDQVRVKEKIPEKLFTNRDDILICTRNGSQRLIGKNVLISNTEIPMTFGAFMSVYRSPFNKFMVHLFKTDNYNEQIQMNLGARINQITTKNLNAFSFWFPSLPEQTKIANFLTAVDKKISLLTQKADLLSQYKKGVMQQIFSQELRFKDDDGCEFGGWEEKSLKEFLVKHDEKTIQSNQYPVLTSSRKGMFFQKDYFDGQDVASKDNTGYNVVPFGFFTFRHMSDDVTFTFNRNYLVDKGIVSTLYPVFTTQYINDDFLQIKLNYGNEFREYALQQKQGGSRTYMYFSKLEKLKLWLPSLPEQTKIANFLTAVDEKITNNQTQLNAVKQYKQGLLQQMFV